MSDDRITSLVKSSEKFWSEIASNVGLVGRIHTIKPEGRVPKFEISIASNGDLTAVNLGVKNSVSNQNTSGTIDGAGGSFGSGSKLLAVAEALERSASCIYNEEDFLWSSAEKLGSEAVSPATFPRLSDAEQSVQNFWKNATSKANIRWVRGISLMTFEEKWIPAVAVFLHLPFACPEERFTFPISTGCAIHSDPLQAIANGLLEVIERDSISIAWLQKLQLPRVLPHDIGLTDGFISWSKRTQNYKFDFFDATTDIGIPVIYGIETAPFHPKIKHVVGAAAGWEFGDLGMKLVRELASCRLALEHWQESDRAVKDFHEVMDGASFMAHPSRSEAFRFLLSNDSTIMQKLSQPTLPTCSTNNTAHNLAVLLDRLTELGHEVFCVPLSTRETIACGLSCFKVLVPSLQPLSFSYSAQFRGHSRLYDAPDKMGYAPRAEADLNKWPQPFA